MSQLLESLRETFQDEEARYAYVESYLNASIAAQIKRLRGDMSQQELAEKIRTKQSGISRLENANYSSWKVETLRKLARAFGLRLRISFEEFGTLVPEIEDFKKGTLKRSRFENDLVFNSAEPEPSIEDAVSVLITPEQSEQIGMLVRDIERVTSQIQALQVDPSVLQGMLDAVINPWSNANQAIRIEQLESHGTGGKSNERTENSVPRKPTQRIMSLNPPSDVSSQVTEGIRP
jgi:transcriptional regulator with XRE-family HTH domain